MLRLSYYLQCVLSCIMPVHSFRKKIKDRRKALKALLDFYKCFSSAAVKCKEVIYIIGDSHTNFFGGNETLYWQKIEGIPEEIDDGRDAYPLFKIFHFGPRLAFSADKEGSNGRVVEKTRYLAESGMLPAKASVMVSLGEIDCRVHVKKQSELQNKTVENIIDDILVHYENYLKMLQGYGYNVICWGPVASQKECEVDPAYPRYGSEEERNEITEIFNRKLKNFCSANSMGFSTLFYEMIDSDYKTKPEFLSADGVHLSQRVLPDGILQLEKDGIIEIKNKQIVIKRHQQ